MSMSVNYEEYPERTLILTIATTISDATSSQLISLDFLGQLS